MKKLILLTLIGFYGGICQAQEFNGNQKDIDQILENVRLFSSYVVAGDIEGITNSYTADAKIFANGLDILKGQDLIREYWQPSDRAKTVMHKIRPSEISIENDIAYDYGYYEGESKYADGGTSMWKGKYVIIWKKVDGDWKMYLDIWNSIRQNQ